MKTLVILATYNERDNLAPLAAEILASPVGADVLVIDDHSPDGTGDVADALSRDNPRVHVIHRPGKLGLGSASIRGLQFGIDRGYDCAVVMDADFSHPPRYLPQIVAGMETYDVTICSRYVRGGGVVNWPLTRRIMSRCINAYARLCLGLRTRDNSGSFRGYRLAMMKSGVLESMTSSGYAYLEEILFRCRSAGMTLGEIPYTFEERRGGKSKISWREATGALWTMFRLLLGRIARADARKPETRSSKPD